MKTSQTKEELRRKFRERRQTMTVAECNRNSRIIQEKLMGSVDWSKLTKIHIYNSVPDWREVDTSWIIKEVKSWYPKVKVEIASLDKDQKPPKEKYDLIIVPVLAFDKDNYRLGLGGGFYDRFLAKQRKAQKIGLAFSLGFVSRLPREPHDIPLDKVITEV